jgi:hypothetical protein
LDIRKNKTVAIYLAVAVFSIIVDKVYAVFGHGVRSEDMTWMFLYPLVGGFAFYLVLEMVFPWILQTSGFRLFYNLYNCGIAIFTTASFMRGVFEIAGTNSPYIIWYQIAGSIFIGAGVIQLIQIILSRYSSK